MTETDWLTGTDPEALIRWAEYNATPRLRTLAEVAQARRLGHLVTPDLGHILDLRERVAAGLAAEADLRPSLHVLDEAAAKAQRNLDRADREHEEAIRSNRHSHPADAPYPTAPLVTGAAALRAQQAGQEALAAVGAVEAVRVAAFGTEEDGPLTVLYEWVNQIAERQAEASAHAELAANWENRAEELAEQFGRYPRRKRQIAAAADEWADRGAHILEGMVDKRLRDAAARARRGFVRTLHDLFGNPFRPVAFDPRWRTADVVGLARGIYDERAFDRMPLLADALMDAGCADDWVIAHCREPGAHYRGCWVVDAVLDLNPTPATR